MTTDTKRCTKCGEVKPLGAFSRNNRCRKDGRVAVCKVCFSAYHRLYYAETREDRRAYHRAYAKAHAVEIAARWAQWTESHATSRATAKAQWEANGRPASVTEKRCAACGAVKRAADFSAAFNGVGRLRNKCKACRAAEQSARTVAHPERAKDVHARWRKRHPERSREKARKYARENREVVTARVRAYRRANPEVEVLKTDRRRARHMAAPGRGLSRAERLRVFEDSLGLCAYCGTRAPLTLDHIVPLAGGGTHDIENVVAACGSCNGSKQDRPLVVWMAWRATHQEAA